jgi:hypothetical protein
MRMRVRGRAVALRLTEGWERRVAAVAAAVWGQTTRTLERLLLVLLVMLLVLLLLLRGALLLLGGLLRLKTV